MVSQFEVIGTKKKLHSSNPNKKSNKKSKKRKKKKSKKEKELEENLKICQSKLERFQKGIGSVGSSGGDDMLSTNTSNSLRTLPTLISRPGEIIRSSDFPQQSLTHSPSQVSKFDPYFSKFPQAQEQPIPLSSDPKNNSNSFVSSMSSAPTSKPNVSEEQAIFMLRNLRDSQNQPILPWLQNIYYKSVLEGKEQEKFNLILHKILPMQNSALYEFFIKKNEVLRQELVPWHARENNQYLYRSATRRGGKKRRKKRKKRQNKSRKKRTRKKKKKKKKNKKKKTRKR